MAVALEDMDAVLNGTTLDLLGDTITYKPSGGSARSFRAIVDYGDDVEQLSGSQVVKGECAVEIPLTEAATRAEAEAAEYTLPRRPGQVFQAKNVMLDKSGTNWLVVLKRKPT